MIEALDERDAVAGRADVEGAFEHAPLVVVHARTGRRQQGEALDLARAVDRVTKRERAAERVPDEERRLVDELVDPCLDRVEERLGRDLRARRAAEPVARVVGSDDALHVRQEAREHAAERGRGGPEAVQEHDGGQRAAAGGVVDVQSGERRVDPAAGEATAVERVATDSLERGQQARAGVHATPLAAAGGEREA